MLDLIVMQKAVPLYDADYNPTANFEKLRILVQAIRRTFMERELDTLGAIMIPNEHGGISKEDGQAINMMNNEFRSTASKYQRYRYPLREMPTRAFCMREQPAEYFTREILEQAWQRTQSARKGMYDNDTLVNPLLVLAGEPFVDLFANYVWTQKFQRKGKISQLQPGQAALFRYSEIKREPAQEGVRTTSFLGTTEFNGTSCAILP